MGLFDDALQGAVPGGDLAKPLAIAAGALILGKLLSGHSASPPPAPTPSAPPPMPDASQAAGGGFLGGLGGLISRMQQSGHGDIASSWVGAGPNAPIAPGQLGSALGQQTISDLARQSGISEQQLLAGLSQMLPGLVDRLTPNGRVPAPHEM